MSITYYLIRSSVRFLFYTLLFGLPFIIYFVGISFGI